MNEVIETVLRQYVNWKQTDWFDWLPVVISSICGRDLKSSGTNAFFLSHGWNQNFYEHLENELFDEDNRKSSISKAHKIIRKLKQVRDWAQASMASAQESQEHSSNQHRVQSHSYKVGDKVWLSLENVKTDRPCKKLDARYSKFTVTEIVGSHSFRLDTPLGIHNVFHSRLLRPANKSLLPGQIVDDNQPLPLLVDGSEEYEIDSILDQKRAPGRDNKKKYLVKWKGFAKPTWEPESSLENTLALQMWKEHTQGKLRNSPGRQKQF